jgi:cell division protein FtsB
MAKGKLQSDKPNVTERATDAPARSENDALRMETNSLRAQNESLRTAAENQRIELESSAKVIDQLRAENTKLRAETADARNGTRDDLPPADRQGTPLPPEEPPKKDTKDFLLALLSSLTSDQAERRGQGETVYGGAFGFEPSKCEFENRDTSRKVAAH